jgi:hypothetical protein
MPIGRIWCRLDIGSCFIAWPESANTKIPKRQSTRRKTKPKTIDFLSNENISKLLAIIYGQLAKLYSCQRSMVLPFEMRKRSKPVATYALPMSELPNNGPSKITLNISDKQSNMFLSRVMNSYIILASKKGSVIPYSIHKYRHDHLSLLLNLHH